MMGLILIGGAAVLCVVAWWQMQTRNNATLAEMEAQERTDADAPDAFRWEEHIEDPDAWKGEDRDDEDENGDDDLVGVR